MNPQQSIFDGYDGYGVYEYSGMDGTLLSRRRRHAFDGTQIARRRKMYGYGLGQVPMLNCPEGQWGSPDLGFPCQPLGMPLPVPPPSSPAVAFCPPGQIGLPPTIPCITWPGATSPVPPQMINPCGPDQFGWPQFGIPCMTAVLPGPCPAGTVGIPPNCVSGVPVPQPAPTGPPSPPSPAPPPPVPPPSKAAAPVSENKWLVPAAIGAGALVLVLVLAGKPKRTTPNRRRRYKRKAA